MTKIDLASLEGLRAACLRIENTKRSTDEAQRWTKELQNFLAWVAAADESSRATLAFQERLWDQNPVSNPGQGNITVAAALQDEAFRRWLAHESVASLPANTQERSGALTALYENLVERLKAYPIARTPRLKIFRVLAAFFPSDFTTVAHGHKLRQLYSRMGGSTTPNPVVWHLFVRGRIAEALGADDLQGGNSAWRMELPWYLYEAIDSETPPDERVTTPGPIAGDEKLVPLPAARRRRGMTSVKGYFTTLLTILEFVKEGVSREELLDYLRAANPDHKESTLRVIVNILRGELAVIRHRRKVSWNAAHGSPTHRRAVGVEHQDMISTGRDGDNIGQAGRRGHPENVSSPHGHGALPTSSSHRQQECQHSESYRQPADGFTGKDAI